MLAGGGVHFFAVHGVVDREDGALRQDLFRDREEAVQVAARIAAQIQNQALHAFVVELLHAGRKLIRGDNVKLGQLQVADLFIQHHGVHGVHLHLAPFHLKVVGLVFLRAVDGDSDRGSFLAADQADHIV